MFFTLSSDVWCTQNYTLDFLYLFLFFIFFSNIRATNNELNAGTQKKRSKRLSASFNQSIRFLFFPKKKIGSNLFLFFGVRFGSTSVHLRYCNDIPDQNKVVPGISVFVNTYTYFNRRIKPKIPLFFRCTDTVQSTSHAS